MSDITTRTVGPEDIIPEAATDQGSAAAEELTIEAQLEQESRLALVESIADEQAVRDDPELYDGSMAAEPEEEAPLIQAQFFNSEPYIAFRAYLSAGPIDTLLGLSEAEEVVATLSEQIAQAKEALGG